MRLFDAEAALIRDLVDESDLVDRKTTKTFTVIAARHPTLGKLVIMHGADGSGIVAETDESRPLPLPPTD